MQWISENQNVIDEIIEYVENNYSDNITLEDLSEKYYISNSYLSKIFKSKTGYTFKKYLYTVRINNAKEIFKASGGESINEVSYRTGFSDLSYFYKVFHKVEGITPGDYIKAFVNNQQQSMDCLVINS